MGCGTLGISLATSLSEQGHVVSVLDPNTEALDRLPRGLIEGGRVVPIQGDATLEAGLMKVNIRDADVFVAVSGKDARNALAAQMARQLYEVPLVICRINDPERQELYNGLGLVAFSATNLLKELVIEAADR